MKIKQHIYFVLKIGYVKQYYDSYIIKYVSLLNKLYYLLFGDVYVYDVESFNQPELLEMRAELNNKLNTFYLNRLKVLEIDKGIVNNLFCVKKAQIPTMNYIQLKNMKEL